jgi:hypothetical protein
MPIPSAAAVRKWNRILSEKEKIKELVLQVGVFPY